MLVALPHPASQALSERSDEELMLLATQGSTQGFEVLVRRHHPRLARFAAKLLGSLSDGDEVAQEALIRLWDSRKRYTSKTSFSAYALTITRNLCRNRVRSESRRGAWQEPLEDGGSASLAETSPEAVDALLKREREERVQQAMGELPEKLREAVLLRFDQELPYADISRVVGKNEVTVRSRVFHGLKKLRESLVGGGS